MRVRILILVLFLGLLSACSSHVTVYHPPNGALEFGWPHFAMCQSDCTYTCLGYNTDKGGVGIEAGHYNFLADVEANTQEYILFFDGYGNDDLWEVHFHKFLN